MQVTATEAKNRFGYYCGQAKIEPVVIEKDGRPDTVLVDFETFQSLKGAFERKTDASSVGADFYRRYKDWVDMQNGLVDKSGIPGEEHRAW